MTLIGHESIESIPASGALPRPAKRGEGRGEGTVCSRLARVFELIIKSIR